MEKAQGQDLGKDLTPSHSLPSQRKGRRALAGALLAFAIVSYLLFRRYEKSPTPAQAARLGAMSTVTVTTGIAKKGHIGVYQEAIGTVTPVYTASVTSQVNGLLTAVHYKEGETVREGDPLIDIDPRPFQAQVLQAQGALDRDTNLLAQAKMDLDRYRAAWARNGIAKQQLDDQEKLVLQDEGQVKSDQGNLQYLRVQLGWCHITAPFTGRVGLRLVDPGNVVVLSPGNQINTTSSLAIITQTQPITVVFTLAEDNLTEVRSQFRRGVSLPVTAYDRALETKLATGTLAAIDNQIDTTTGTVKLRAVFENKDDALFPNQFVNTKLLVRMLNGVTLIPTNAIQHNGEVTFVYVIDQGLAHAQTVKSGPADGAMTVVEGISPGTVVATSSFERLQNDTLVVPRKPAPARARNTVTP